MARRWADRTAVALLAALGVLACAPDGEGAPRSPLERIPLPAASTLESAVVERIERARLDAGRELEAADDDAARARALGELARVYHAHALLPSGRAAYGEALRFAPDDPDLLYLSGQLELDAADAAAAVERLSRAVAAAPLDAHALAALSGALRALGRTEEARASAGRATEADPGFGLGWLGLAEAAADLGDDDAAAAAYSRFFALHPDASKYRAPYGLVLGRAGRGEEAAEQLALRGDGVPAIADPRLAAVVALRVGARAATIEGAKRIEAGRLDEAVELLSGAVALDAADADAHRNLAVALAKLGRYAEALPHVEAAVRLRPRGRDERFTLGAVLAELGRSAQAEAAYLETLELDPGHLDSIQNLAKLRLLSGRAGEALAGYLRLREGDRGRAAAWLGIATAELELGRERDARRTLDEALAALPLDGLVESAWCRLASAARDPGARDVERALARARGLAERLRHPYVLETLAMAQAAAGDFAAAVSTQKRAIELTAPDSSPTFRARLATNLERYSRGEPCRDPALR